MFRKNTILLQENAIVFQGNTILLRENAKYIERMKYFFSRERNTYFEETKYLFRGNEIK